MGKTFLEELSGTANLSNVHDFQPSNSTSRDLSQRTTVDMCIQLQRCYELSALFKIVERAVLGFYLEKLNLKNNKVSLFYI